MCYSGDCCCCCESLVMIVVVVVNLSLWLLLLLWISHYDCCCVDPPYYARWRFLIYCLSQPIFTILLLNHLCLGVGVLPNHPLVCKLPSHYYLPVLNVPFPIIRQKNLFCLFVHHGIHIRNSVGILSYYPSWLTPSGSNSSFPLLSGMSSQQDISPKRVWVETPK